MTDPDRARALRRRHVHERQAVIFGILLAILAVAGVSAAAIYTGNLNVPFFARGFSSKPTPSVTRQPAPCPPQGALPVAANTIKVNVYNGANRAGLAASAAVALGQAGFTIGTTANATTQFIGSEQISFGVAGVAQAYTVAAHFKNPVLLLIARADPKDATVDVTLGSDFDTLVPNDQVGLDPNTPLVGQPGCVPVEQLAAQASAKPAATPTPTKS